MRDIYVRSASSFAMHLCLKLCTLKCTITIYIYTVLVNDILYERLETLKFKFKDAQEYI